MRLPCAARLSALILPAALMLSPAAAAPPTQAAPPEAAAPSVPAETAAKTGAKVADLPEALARLAAITSPADYAASLDAFSTSLPPPDALALLGKALDRAGPEYRTRLLVKAGDLALLLGLFGEAASRYEEAGGKVQAPDGALLLRSARCYLAAGDPEKAQALSSELMLKLPLFSGPARLVVAWALALQGRPADARAIAASLVGSQGPEGPAPAEQRREARFILWLFAPEEEKAGAASALASEFPGSIEAAIASGASAPPPLPHWYLGGLGGLGSPGKASPGALPGGTPTPSTAQTSSSAANPASPATAMPETAAAKTPAQGAGGKRLQLGYFSVEENATALKVELLAKRFAASVELRTKTGAAGKAEERRWIVVVDGRSDMAKTIQALKDAGYESYIIE